MRMRRCFVGRRVQLFEKAAWRLQLRRLEPIHVIVDLAHARRNHGPIDGVMGARTSYAIRAYEHDHGLPVDGMISGPLMRNMGLRY